MKNPLKIVAGALVLLAAFSAAAADAYPSKPIRFLIPFAPGGGNDIIGRVFAAKLGDMWHQQMVVDNRPGAGGNLAAETTARAAPDGYTVFQFNVANTIAPSIYPKLAYDPARDFAAVTQMAASPFILMVNPSVRATNVKEFIALAKANKGKFNYGSSGNGGSTHLVMELFKSMAGVEMTHIPYNGAGPAITDLIAGQLQVMLLVPATAMQHIKSGKLHGLAVSGARRIALAPELPTIAEAGVPGFEGGTWYGVVVPAGTPRPIVNQLSRDYNRVLHMPDVRERLIAQGVEPVGTTPEQFEAFIRSEIAKWAKVVKISGARVE